MFKIVGWRRVLASCCLLVVGMSLLFFSGVFTPVAQAAGNPQVSITFPLVNGVATGHVNTRVTISGSGFGSGMASLYTTSNSDPTKCIDQGNPSDLGLTPFSTRRVFIAGGSFQLQSTWPSTAGNPGTSYYICVVKHGSSTLSSNTFTVAQPATVSVAPTTAAPGAQVAVTGTNWLPPQLITVSIIAGNNNNQAIASQSVTSDPQGNLNVSLTIPASAPSGAYSVTAYAQNETTMNANASNALTVSTATATPSASPSPSPSVIASPTGTPTRAASPAATQNTNGTFSDSNGGLSGNTILFILIGIGILLVIAGSILFIVYGRIH